MGILWDYSDLHAHVVNRQIRMLGQILHLIGGSVLGDKGSTRDLKKTLKELSD